MDSTDINRVTVFQSRIANPTERAEAGVGMHEVCSGVSQTLSKSCQSVRQRLERHGLGV